MPVFLTGKGQSLQDSGYSWWLSTIRCRSPTTLASTTLQTSLFSTGLHSRYRALSEHLVPSSRDESNTRLSDVVQYTTCGGGHYVRRTSPQIVQTVGPLLVQSWLLHRVNFRSMPIRWTKAVGGEFVSRVNCAQFRWRCPLCARIVPGQPKSMTATVQQTIRQNCLRLPESTRRPTRHPSHPWILLGLQQGAYVLDTLETDL